MNDTLDCEIVQDALVAPVQLTEQEVAALSECESVIDRARKFFIEAGQALATIRDDHLFRSSHATFESYCKERWNIGRTYAWRLIESAATAKVMLPIGNVVALPQVESHIRPLLQFSIEDRPAVWQAVVEQMPVDDNGVPILTASKIDQTIKREIEWAKAGPFRNRRLQIKREKRLREEERRNSAPNLNLYLAAEADQDEMDESAVVPDSASSMAMMVSDDIKDKSLPQNNNAIAYIRGIFSDGQYHFLREFTELLPPEMAVRSWINEAPAEVEQQKKHDLLSKVEDYGHVIFQGKRIVEITLNALVWMGEYDRIDDDGEVRFCLHGWDPKLNDGRGGWSHA